MMHRRISRDPKPLMLLFSLGLLLGSCSKKEAAPTIDFGPEEGFSYRSAGNVPIGAQDLTDWTLDTKWNQQEKDLFKSLGLNLDDENKVPATAIFIAGYPNPATSAISFRYALPSAAMAKVLVVDNHYQVLQEVNATPPNQYFTFMLDLTTGKFEKGQRYRFYYVLYNNPSYLYLKGHGDFKMQ